MNKEAFSSVAVVTVFGDIHSAHDVWCEGGGGGVVEVMVG